MNDKKKCCICGKSYDGYGNNPAPVKNSGLCCDACNYGVVIPLRIANAAKQKLAEAQNASRKL